MLYGRAGAFTLEELLAQAAERGAAEEVERLRQLAAPKSWDSSVLIPGALSARSSQLSKFQEQART